MKVIIGLLLALLLAFTHCQQAITLESCLYIIGVLTADISLVYRYKKDPEFLQKARADLETLYVQCRVVLPEKLGAVTEQTAFEVPNETVVANKKRIAKKIAMEAVAERVRRISKKSLGRLISREIIEQFKSITIDDKRTALASWAAYANHARAFKVK